uniref:Uncharacterized protein n=1 Tax=Bactrocera latifrons TaxID=174628 RepID=A0A0K8W6K4_BACLA
MSLCAYPQVRIYEDFDKMSAKEVYYNEAGNKVTVKLLHFPDVPPEEVDNMKFDDDADYDEEAVEAVEMAAHTNCKQCCIHKVVGSASSSLVNGMPRVKSSKAAAEDDDLEEEEDNDPEEDEVDETGRLYDETAEREEDELLRPHSPALPMTTHSYPHPVHQHHSHSVAAKKIFRKKSTGSQTHARKCSLAFAQAHGLPVSVPPTIMVPPRAPASNELRDCALRRHLQLQRRSPSPQQNLCPGYTQYSKSFLEVPLPRDYGYASSDDLSSEWDSDVPTMSASRGQTQTKKVNMKILDGLLRKLALPKLLPQHLRKYTDRLTGCMRLCTVARRLGAQAFAHITVNLAYCYF